MKDSDENIILTLIDKHVIVCKTGIRCFECGKLIKKGKKAIRVRYHGVMGSLHVDPKLILVTKTYCSNLHIKDSIIWTPRRRKNKDWNPFNPYT